MMLRNLRLRKKNLRAPLLKNLKEFCAAHCTGFWSAASPDFFEEVIELSLTEDADVVLVRLNFESSEVEVTEINFEKAGEPAFTVEELEAEIPLRDARSYVLGKTGWQARKKNKAFVEEVKQWCKENLNHETVLIMPWDDTRAVIGIPDYDDRMLFLLRWEGNPMVHLSKTHQWAAEVDENCTDFVAASK